MHKYWLLPLLLIAACDVQLPSDANPDLYGTWEWVRTSGGIGGISFTPESEGLTATLVMSEDHRYTVRQLDEVVEEGTYRVDYGRTEDLWTITYNNPPEYATPPYHLVRQQLVYRLDSKELVLGDACFDCYTKYYIRRE